MVRKIFVWAPLAEANGKEGFSLAVDFSQRNKGAKERNRIILSAGVSPTEME